MDASRWQGGGQKDNRLHLSIVGTLLSHFRISGSQDLRISGSQDLSVSAFPKVTPLPELYKSAAPMLRCTSGQISHIQVDDTLGIHLAFFEWDGTDTGSILEAFRHIPEACMGSIGMQLVSKEEPVPYQIGDETFVFDHTIFREPGQGRGGAAFSPQIHAFRAVWVSGEGGSNYREGIRGETIDRLTHIRLKSAITRYRPPSAKVIQGAVWGASNGTAAWESCEQAVLLELAK